MYIPQTVLTGTPSTTTPFLSLDRPSRLAFDLAGVLGFIGGYDAVSAMATVHVYSGRRWLGWFNNPGSFQMSELLGSFAKSASLSRVFGRNGSMSVHMNPTALLWTEASKRPKFRAAHSGTVIEETGYPAELFMKECTARSSEGRIVPGRKTQPVGITVVDLGQAPPYRMLPARSSVFSLVSAAIPIATNIGTCAACAMGEDWYATSLILIGIVVGGITGLVFGSADLVFTHPEPAKGSPAGDGILSTNNDLVLLRGSESAVNSITRGKFTLRFANQAHFYLVKLCSFLFLIQAIAQLLLIPQVSLFGQIMFLISLGISALYNAWMSSTDNDKFHRKLLFRNVLENPTVTKYTLGTRTTAVVFMLLVLKLQDSKELLNELLPNDTKVWKQWKMMILERLRYPNDQSFEFGSKSSELYGFTQSEKDLLRMLLEDARSAYGGYKDYLGVKSL